jgi:RsiW-degrading membrane proteinase PrsW (M82 family)
MNRNEYCILDLPDGSYHLQLCDVSIKSQFKDQGERIILIMMIISLVCLIFAFINIWLKSREKLFGVMTLALISMLFTYFLTLLLAHFINLDNGIPCKVCQSFKKGGREAELFLMYYY